MAKILVIEDNPANARLAEFLLRRAGYAVLTAEDGASGIALAKEMRPDLVLMDIQLPGMDGLEATRLLKADPVTSNIPVLALTALAMKGDAERILAAGCNGYLAKPYGHDEFLKAVQAALRPAPKARRRAGRG